MKEIIKIAVCAQLLVGFICKGISLPENVWVNECRLIYCSHGERHLSPMDLYIYSVVTHGLRVRRLPNFTGLWGSILNVDKCRVFPVPWTVCIDCKTHEAFLSILHPNLFHANLFEQIKLMSWIGSVDNQWYHVTSVPDWNGVPLSLVKSTYDMGGIRHLQEYYRENIPKNIIDVETCPFKVPWYISSGTNVLFRLPIQKNNVNKWTVCQVPSLLRWVELCYRQRIKNLNDMPVTDEFIKSSFDIVYDSNWNPMCAARVAGKQVLSDSAEAKFPKDADWLIWEKSPDASRLCKMEKGKWSTCPDMPVQKPPQLIVTDDDHGVVLLIYSFGIDQSDVEGSLRKVAKMLEDRGFPLKPRQAKPALEKKENDAASSQTNTPPPVATALRPPVAHRPNTNRVNGVQNHVTATVTKGRGTNSVMRITDAESAAAEKEFARLGLKPEEKAKRGAILYEKPESRREGLRLLKEAAHEGSAFAIARLSALYYVGEGGVKRDYAKAVKLMEAAAARGLPCSLLPLDEAKKAMEREAEMNKKGKPGLWPGMGYHGVLLPYRTSRALQKMLDKYSLSAGVFRRDPLSDVMISEEHRENYLLTEEVPYLLFTPKTSYSSVPLVMYFGGTGEQGSDLTRHFRQRTIFEMVCSPEFQKRRPCYLFAPMVPKGSEMCGARGYSPPMADLVCDAMYAVIRSVKSPSVDTNRLYLTGLSWGGEAAYTFPFGYPGRFAASVPVAGFATAYCVPESKPGNFWLLFNEHEYADKTRKAALDEMIRVVTSRGGEFRSSSFPDTGHNSWDKAWREETVWDWMFSKTADGRAVQKISRKTADIPVSMRGIRCAASKPGRDTKTGPERAADGLDATCYVSKTPFKSGDWWQIDFAEPVSGRVIVKSGYVNGRGHAKSAHVETSTNGKSWTRRGGFSKASGECRFPLNSSVRHLRVVSRSNSGETMVIREVEIVK